MARGAVTDSPTATAAGACGAGTASEMASTANIKGHKRKVLGGEYVFTCITVCVSVCVCTMIVLRMCTYIRSLFCVLKGHVSTPLGPLRRPL